MEHRSLRFQAIGTHWEIQIFEALGEATWRELRQVIKRRIGEFDALYSRFKADSWVSQMAQKPGRYQLPADALPMLQLYEKLYEVTDGLMTPLIGQVMSDAGYDASYSFRKADLRQPPTWRETLTFDEKSVTLTRPELLDFGAAGKGYLVDIVSELIAAEGIRTYVVNAGGDILRRTNDGSTLEVGLENPFDTSEAIGVVRLGNQSMCASAGSKRKWGTYNHIINPHSLRSPTEVVATWVIADDTMTADGLATALFFTSPERLLRDFSFTYAVLNSRSELIFAKDFPVTVFQAA